MWYEVLDYALFGLDQRRDNGNQREERNVFSSVLATLSRTFLNCREEGWRWKSCGV